MQATGFKLPLATYLVLPEAGLPASLREGADGDGGASVREGEGGSFGSCRKLFRPGRFPCETRGWRRGGVAETRYCSSALLYLYVALLLLLLRADPRPR